jgi:hypothetical protein
MLEIEGVDAISDEMRAVIEDEWPELMHQLLGVPHEGGKKQPFRRLAHTGRRSGALGDQ